MLEDFSKCLKISSKNLFKTDFLLVYYFVLKEIILKPCIFKSKYHLRLALSYHLKRIRFSKYFHSYLLKSEENIREALFVTFWFNYVTDALCMLKQKLGIKVFSRAHGYDLYEDRIDPPFIPSRSSLLSKVDHVFPDSRRGSEYLISKYSEHFFKITTAYMGTQNPGFTVKASDKNSFVIVSCSIRHPIKRIDAICNAIVLCARKKRETNFKWVHIGNDHCRDYEKKVSELCWNAKDTSNLSFERIKFIDNENLFKSYRKHRFDLFINLSDSEGTPVSIIEALSLGLPVIGSDVGGIPDMIDGNGFVVDCHLNFDEIVGRILAIVDQKENYFSSYEEMKVRSKLIWDQNYNQDRCYKKFYQKIFDEYI